MIIYCIREIKSMNDFRCRVEAANKRNKGYPDAIVVETKKAFNQFCLLLGGKPWNKKGFYSYSFRGIPLILPWQSQL